MGETIKEKVKKIDCFYNEQGDYTITHQGEPIAICKTQSAALRLVNAFRSLEIRVATLSIMNQDNYKTLQKIKSLISNIR